MRRKIILHGPSSMTVSLPSLWVKQNSLRKGDDVDISEENNNLMIRPVQTMSTIKSVEISFVGLDPGARNDVILALHKKGYDEIKILVERQNVAKELHAHLNQMQLGYEIIKQESNSITIRNILNPEIEQFDNLFRRIFRMTLEYSRKIKAILESKEDMTDSCLMHETSINRISNYCRRIIVKDRIPNSCFLYSILDDLNIIVHDMTTLLYEIRSRNNVSKRFVKRYSEICDLLADSYELYYKFSLIEYNAIKRRSDALDSSDMKDISTGPSSNSRSKEVSSRDSSRDISKDTSKELSCYWDYVNSMRERICNLLESILAIQL